MDMIYRLKPETIAFLRKCGHMKRRMNYPRWDGRKWLANHALELWRYSKANRLRTDKQHALHVLAMQTFTGINPEWVESTNPWAH